MTLEEAIKRLEFDRAMILFNATTGKEITPEILKLINEDNYRTYVADGVAIEALKEIQQYRAIGTVEECRKAVEKQKAKKPKEILRHRGGFEMHHCPNCDTHYQTDNRYTIKDNYCPVCGKLLDSAFRNYCGNCGQAIQWEENLEGTRDE